MRHTHTHKEKKSVRKTAKKKAMTKKGIKLVKGDDG